ncbi:hypothetical protein FB451DRAFT_1251847 [Mycena latifolia]|nr:hypothetical protein FB451DRAFT_1251847 [Mycena latifolia]
MSLTITESPVQFPDTWLTPADDEYVIDHIHWNTEADPEDPKLKMYFSVEWDLFCGYYLLLKGRRGVEVGGLILRLYFGIVGCIVPIGCLPEFDEHIFAFTLAGPCDAAGKKEFYIMVYSASLEETSLGRLTPGFSSVSDFHLNRSRTKTKSVAPVEGGKEALQARLEELGLRKKRVVDDGDISDWV